jgi:HK97 family phage major capsid protein
MPTLAELTSDLEKAHEGMKGYLGDLDKKGSDYQWNAEEKTEVDKRLGELRDLKGRLMQAQDQEKTKGEVDTLLGGLGLHELNGLKGHEAEAKVRNGAAKSLGERFVDAPQFKEWIKAVAPNGTVNDSTKGITSPPVPFAGFKDLITGLADSSAGALVFPDRAPLLDLPQRPLTLRDLVTVGRTGSDTIEYVRVVSTTNAATTVAEATAATGTSGLKPESAMTFTRETATVKTVAHWIPATKRSLSDAAQLRTLVDNFLRYGLELALEAGMAVGDGVGEHFLGISNTPGVQAQAWDTDILVTTRRARTKVTSVGLAQPSGYLLHPIDWETIELSRENGATGAFLFGGPATLAQPRLWGLPVVVSESIPQGTGYVGDFRQCVLWDREQASVQVSDSHADFFTRNLVAILAELRAAFGILRPMALVEMDLTAA